MNRRGFFGGRHHTPEARRLIGAAARGRGRGGFNVRVKCPNCQREMSPANLVRHLKPCETYGDYSRKRKNRQRLLRSYGLNLLLYEAILNKQGGVCAICFQPEKRRGRSLVVDHDHSSHLIRGLLCCRCNRLLGFVEDEQALLMAAARYLISRADPEFDPYKD